MAIRNPYENARPGSFASTIRVDAPETCQIALLGLPDDTGVKMNHGRPGAKDGPRAFREQLCRYGSSYFAAANGEKRISLSSVSVYDAGDIQLGETLDATHNHITEKITELLTLNLLPICIGGGHDLTWPAIRAVAKTYPDLAGVYFDAHLDVRDELGSGMSFRKILTETTCDDLVVCHLDWLANSQEHVIWFETHGGRIQDDLLSIFREFRVPNVFASFDLDAVNVAQAPGVSAINVTGIDAHTAYRTASFLGREPRIRYFDIMELNPTYDIDSRTARLAVRLFLSFVTGFALRS